ncbi:MAG: glycosyltransferase family 4 protein [Gammaproteobacteria bacterium]|nr:glycosyltransferase family 4 protein [Gammaproteobacteria bacterium]
MMRVAVCIFKYFPYGGLQQDCVKVVKECLKRHHQVDIYTMAWQGEQPQGCRVITVAVRGWGNHRRCLAFSDHMVTQLKKEHYDVVLGFNRMAGLDCYYAGDLCFVAESHANYRFWFRLTSRYRAYAALERAVFAATANCQILALTHQQIEDYRYCYHTPAQRFHLLPPGIDPQFMLGEDYPQLRQQYRQQFDCDDALVMLMVGSDFRRKGLKRTLIALAALPSALKQQSQLWVVGDDNPKPWQRLIKRLGIAHQVKFFGPQQQVRPFYYAADLLMHPAHHEAAGMVLLEAIACGLTVVTTAVCGYAHHIIKSRGGVVISSPFKQQQLDKEIARLLGNHGLRQGYIANTLTYRQQVDLYHCQVEVVNQLEAIAQQRHGV